MLKHNNYKDMSLYEILKTFPHQQRASVVFYCAKEVEPFTNDQRVIDGNLVLQRWLKGDKSVDLITARDNAWNAVVSYTTDAATFYAISVAANVAAATPNASYAVSSLYFAANAKSYNICPNNQKQRTIVFNQFYNEHKQIAKNWLSYWNIPNFPKDEPDFPIFDFLQDYNLISYLLPKKEDYYYLNLNGFDLKHHNEAELLKEIDTMHIKNILRRIVNNAEAQQL